MTVAERSIRRTARWSKDAGAPICAGEMAIDPLQSPLYPVTPATGAAPASRAAGTAHAGGPFEALLAESAKPPVAVHPGPAEDALTAVQVAAEAYEVLRQHGRELRFEARHGLIRIEVYDGTGRLVRAIPPNEALAIAAGEASWQA